MEWTVRQNLPDKILDWKIRGLRKRKEEAWHRERRENQRRWGISTNGGNERLTELSQRQKGAVLVEAVLPGELVARPRSMNSVIIFYALGALGRKSVQKNNSVEEYVCIKLRAPDITVKKIIIKPEDRLCKSFPETCKKNIQNAQRLSELVK